MAVSGLAPFIHVEDANGLPYVGAVLKVYEVNSTTYRAIYSDRDLLTPLTNPLSGSNASDASGKFPRFYMEAGQYKLRAETATGTLIWEYDYIDTGISSGSPLPVASGGTGATTAPAALSNLGAASASDVEDLADQIGAFSASLSSSLTAPQGRLTLTSGTPVLVTGVTAGTAVYYTPYIGNLCPIYDGTQFNPETFSELTLTLNSSYILNSHYDCFIINDGGTIRIVTGPAWNTITAGAGARGSGAGTTELTRLNGLWVNANAMATARNGSSTYSVDANKGTYVGSLYIDGTAGQISCHTAFGQSRKWGVWNAYNRKPIILLCGDPTSTWTTAPTTWRQSRADTGNKITVFSGLPEEIYENMFRQLVEGLINTSTARADIGVGYNSTTVLSGMKGENLFASAIGGNQTVGGNMIATYDAPPSIGINNVNALEQAPNGSTSNTFYGTERSMQLRTRWMG